MAANRYMVDSGGTTRHIKKRYVIDSGGVARLIKKRYIVDAGGVTRLTFIFGDQLTMVAGTNSSSLPGSPGYYKQGPSSQWEGTMTPGTLGDTSPITALVSNSSGNLPNANPGWWFVDIGPVPGYSSSSPLPQSYLTEIVVSGPGVGTVTLSGSSATFTRTLNVNGSWAWGPGLPAFTSGDTYSVSVVRSNA
jgi:hypothetical protein